MANRRWHQRSHGWMGYPYLILLRKMWMVHNQGLSKPGDHFGPKISLLFLRGREVHVRAPRTVTGAVPGPHPPDIIACAELDPGIDRTIRPAAYRCSFVPLT